MQSSKMQQTTVAVPRTVTTRETQPSSKVLTGVAKTTNAYLHRREQDTEQYARSTRLATARLYDFHDASLRTGTTSPRSYAIALLQYRFVKIDSDYVEILTHPFRED